MQNAHVYMSGMKWQDSTGSVVRCKMDKDGVVKLHWNVTTFNSLQ